MYVRLGGGFSPPTRSLTLATSVSDFDPSAIPFWHAPSSSRVAAAATGPFDISDSKSIASSKITKKSSEIDVLFYLVRKIRRK
jgi:hypothetical protein